jgi:hypothetical protein
MILTLIHSPQFYCCQLQDGVGSGTRLSLGAENSRDAIMIMHERVDKEGVYCAGSMCEMRAVLRPQFFVHPTTLNHKMIDTLIFIILLYTTVSCLYTLSLSPRL